MNHVKTITNSWTEWRDSLQKTYAALGDDISREVFGRFLLRSLLNADEEIVKLIRDINPKTKELEASKLCFYGAGKGAEWFLDPTWNWMLRGNPKEQPVIDNRKTGTLHNHPIITFEQFMKLPDYKDYLVIITLGDGLARQSIADQLDRYNVRYIMAYDELDIGGRTYFDLPYMEWREEYFVDAGALDGETTKAFFKRCPNGHAYVFEPNPAQFEITKETLRDYPSIELFPYAVYDKDVTVRFDTADVPSSGNICARGGGH